MHEQTHIGPYESKHKRVLICNPHARIMDTEAKELSQKFFGLQEINQPCLDTDNQTSTTFPEEFFPQEGGIMVPNSFMFDSFSVNSLTPVPSSDYH